MVPSAAPIPAGRPRSRPSTDGRSRSPSAPGGASDFIDGGDDRVIVPFIEQGLGKASGVEIEQRPAFVCALRNGKILSLTEFRTEAEALEAAGLRESPDTPV